MRRDPRRAETRRRVLDAARRLFLARPYEEVTLNDLLEAAGLQKGGLYHHFADKRAVFRAVFEEVNAELGARSAAAAAAAGGPDPWDRVKAGYAAFYDAMRDPALHRLFYRDGLAVLGFRDWLGIGNAHCMAAVEGAFAELDAAGALGGAGGAPRPDLLMMLITGACDYASDWALGRPPGERAAALDAARDAVLGLVDLYRGRAAVDGARRRPSPGA